VAIDPGNPGSPVTVVSQEFATATFSPSGILYAADYTGDRVVTVSPTGVVATFLSGINEPEGLAINPAGNRLYVASTAAPGDSIYSVTIPGGVVATLPFGPDLQDGIYPTGMVVYASKLFWAADSANAGDALYIYHRNL
jgi:DNA-binding beta-propeller fold protein YncE